MSANINGNIGEYLANLKEGANIYRMAGGANLERVRIARITPTQIILVSGGRYSRKTGDSIGGPRWNRSNIVLPTAEIKQAWQSVYLGTWASNALPALYQGLTPAQQLALYRHVHTLVSENKGTEAKASIADDL